MATGLFLLSVTAPLGLGLAFMLIIAMELSSRLKRCQKERDELRAQRDGMARELLMLRKRWFGPEASSGRGSVALSTPNLDAFNRLRSLVIKTLHPDAAPEDSAAAKTLRSEMFKAVWPEIIKIENETGPRSEPDPHHIIQNDRRRPVTVADLGKVYRPDAAHGLRRSSDRNPGATPGGWRERRKVSVRD